MFEILLFAGVCVFLVYLFTLYSSTDVLSTSGIPGPSLLQLILHILKNRLEYDVVEIVNSLHKRYGQTFSIQLRPFSPIVVTSDHSYFAQILASKEYLDKPAAYNIYEFLGDSLGITLKTDIWRHDRKVLNEAFGHESFKVALENLNQKLHELEQIMLEKINDPIDMQAVLHNFILHTTVESLKDPSIEWDSERTNAYNKSSSMYKEYLMKTAFTKLFNLDRIFFSWITRNENMEKERRAVRQYAMDMVDVHLKANKSQIDTNNIIHKMHSAGIPYRRIVDNVLLFMEAGHDTTATTLAYLFYEIAKKPDVQDKINAEINVIIGNDPNATISTVDLQQMKYVDCVVKEGLRMHTTISYIMRKLNKSAVVNNASLPQGTNVVFFIDGLQKSEKYYKDPLVFDPDRFSGENRANLVTNTWAPFSLGIRNCIGKSLAMQTVKLILAKSVRSFHFSPVVPEHVLDIKSALLTKSMNGVPVNVKVRNCS